MNQEPLFKIDLNCDLGEGMENDGAIMPWISSANIACGYHAGDVETMWKTVELALQHQVAVGAHVSFRDKENFGRKEMNLSPADVYDLVVQQLIIIREIADPLGTRLHHVKPHGALYNMAARDPLIAQAVAAATRDIDTQLILYGLSGSHSITEAEKAGLATAGEVFADRAYLDDASLSPRSMPGALLEDADQSLQQVLQMIQQGTVTAMSGKVIPVKAGTVCLHGDGKHAVSFAKHIHEHLRKNNIAIQTM